MEWKEYYDGRLTSGIISAAAAAATAAFLFASSLF
jgi:hypothetical protein